MLHVGAARFHFKGSPVRTHTQQRLYNKLHQGKIQITYIQICMRLRIPNKEEF